METKAHGMLLEMRVEPEPHNDGVVLMLEVLPFDAQREVPKNPQPVWIHPIGLGMKQLRELHARLTQAIQTLDAGRATPH